MLMNQNLPIASLRLLDQNWVIMSKEIRELQDLQGVKPEQIDGVDSISLALYDVGKHIDQLYLNR